MRLPSAALVLFVWLAASEVSAQCACDHEIAVGTRVVDGETLGAGPGDVICLAEGESGGLVLENLSGTAAMPIVVRACGSRTVTGTGSVGIDVSGARHVRLTSGDDGEGELVVRGFSRGIFVREGSTGIEIDHVEIDGASFVGVDVRSTPLCDGTWARESFVMDGLHLHHNHIHDVGSAMYLGELACTSGIVCGDERVYPHEVLHADVHDNVMERSSRTMLKIACSPDALVHHNVVRDYGTGNESPENTGLEPREGTTVRLFSNLVLGGTGHGIFVKSAAPTEVFNNVVVDAGAHGIALTGRSATDVGYLFAHNTIVRPHGSGLLSWSSVGAGEAIANLVVAPGEGLEALGAGWTMDANLLVASVDEALFVNAAENDYDLAAGSPAIDSGADSSIETDFLGRPRDESPDVGAFEHGAVVPTDAGMEADAASPPSDAGVSVDGALAQDAAVSRVDAGATAITTASCGCAAPGRARRGATTLALLGCVFLVVTRRRRARPLS